MRLKALSAVVALLWLALVPIRSYGDQNEEGPVAFFPQTVHEFSPILEGTPVVHDFVIQNKGSAVLNVERVKTG